MAPRRPANKRSSRPSSGSAPPSPTKPSTPRKSGDQRRRQSGDPTAKRTSTGGAGAASPGKRTSRDVDGTPGKRVPRDNEGTPGKKHTSRDVSASPVKDEARERRRRSSSSPTKPAAGGTPKKSSGTPKKGTPSKAKPKPVVVEQDGSQTSLSADSLAKLDAQNTRETEKARKQEKGKVVTGRVVKDRSKKRKAGATGQATAAGTGAAMLTEKNLHGREGTPRKNRDRVRAVANSVIDAGSNSIRRHRGGGKNHMDRPSNTSRRRKFLCLGALFIGVLLIILVPVGVLVVGKQNGGDDSDPSGPNNSNLGGISPDSIPQWAKGGPLDPFSWYDTQDFNLTFTNTSVGGLPIMGLNSTWDDSVAANDNVPPLDKPFGYGTQPIRGVNLGGWFSIEPFITPSMFNRYSSSENVVDEWTLCQKLGSTSAKSTLEQHYSSFINAQSFAEVRAAGFDHVRIPFSYWAVTTYPGDPYVAQVSWRYLLRAIEYARQNGIRVKLDLHGLPGSQNGWNHSGRQGPIGWLNGTDGDLNAQRSLDLHDQLSKFFAQPRYANVIGIYGLVNEPKMISLPLDPVLNWTTHAIDIVRGNGLQQWIAVADGFLGLPKWQGQLSGEKNVVLDAHQYVIFNTGQIGMDHTAKLNYACEGWTGQMQQSTNTATGFGPTLCGEWSQADTDCTTFVNNVNVGSRWTGTMDLDDPSLDVLTPECPLHSNECSCDSANAQASTYSQAYKQWLLWNAEAQMNSFEIGLGWFYWTWLTESATQWSWKLGMEAGILPQKVWDREFTCNTTVPDFGNMGLAENY